jgi:Family of unknown function (DUF6444)
VAGGEQGGLVSRLRAVIAAKDDQIAGLKAGLDAALARLEASAERERRLELRLAELERRLSMDSSDSGTPCSKERIGAKEARRARQESERGRRKDRKRGGQPGHQGKGLERDPDPGEKKDAAPPAEKMPSCPRSPSGDALGLHRRHAASCCPSSPRRTVPLWTAIGLHPPTSWTARIGSTGASGAPITAVRHAIHGDRRSSPV